MASKVLVNLPAVSFLQGKKSSADMVTLHERSENLTRARKQPSNVTDRIAQLEQNIKFLQEEHQAMLAALHREIELLRQKNRDLQFELVLAKESTSILSSPTSPEDNGSGFTKSKSSPVSVNVRPLHIELLEKDLQDAKASLQEARSQNKYLTNVIEEQKMESNHSNADGTTTTVATTDNTADTTTTASKKAESSSSNSSSSSSSNSSSNSVAIQVRDSQLDPIRAELVVYSRMAESLIKRLRRKTEEQRKEIAMLRASSIKSSETGMTSHSGNPTASISQTREPKNSRHRGGPPSNGPAEQISSHKFPPLQTQGYWLRRFSRSGKNRHEKADHPSDTDSPTSLPHLPDGSGKAEVVHSESPVNHPFRGYRNQYREESNRKYRSQISQQRDRDRDRDRREPDQHYYQQPRRQQQHTSYHRQQSQQYHYRRDYKERNAKERPKADSEGESDGGTAIGRRDNLQH